MAKITFYQKAKAAYQSASARVMSGEELHVHFSHNSKTNMYSIDLPPLLTCHGRCRELCGKTEKGKCLPVCYATHYLNRFPEQLDKIAVNTALAILRPDQYWTEVCNMMKTQRFMRLFASGDMIINGYFDRLCKALAENPHCHIQGFTKCYEIVNRYIDTNGSLPANLHLLFSGWFEYQAINPHNLPESRVYEGDRPESWLTCGSNCSACACVGLGCWKACAGDIIGLKKH